MPLNQYNTPWLTLDGFYSWQQPTPVGEDRYQIRRRELWYMLKCYLVKKAESAALFEWGKEQNWQGRWMPEADESHDTFLGEYSWSQSFKDHDCYYYGRPGWTRGDNNRIPTEVLICNDGYSRDGLGFDCSIDERISINLPCRFLIEGMDLDWRGEEGYWYDKKGRLVAFDPSVLSQGPSVLLFGRQSIAEFLEKKGLTLFWTILGEKQTLGTLSSPGSFHGRLEINGAYILQDGEVVGRTRSRFVPNR